MLLSVSVDGDELLAPERSSQGPIPRHGSFLLAPWVGELFEGRLEFEGGEFRVPVNVGRHAVHGLVFSGAWEVEIEGVARVVLRRELGPEWPFSGTVRQAFDLDAQGLTQTAEVIAADRAMPVGVGWHPWFRVSDPGQTRVLVDAARHLELDAELIPTGRVREVEGDLDLRQDPILGARRIDVVYLDVAGPASLSLPGRVIDVSFDPAISIVVVYVTEGSVCIEPWTMWPDASRWAARGRETGLRVLAPHESLRRWMRWSWSRPRPVSPAQGPTSEMR